MTPLEVLLLLWAFLSVLVACVFSIVVTASKDADVWDELAKRPMFTVHEGGRLEVRRKPPFDWSVDAREIA